MTDNLISLMKSSSIFSSLSSEDCSVILKHAEIVTLQKDEVLFQQNEPSEWIYILLEGVLSAYLNKPNGDHLNIGSIQAGETVGELGMYSKQPRTLSVKSLTKAQILKFSAYAFNEIYTSYPAIAYNIIQPMVARSEKILQFLMQKRINKHIVIIPVNNSVSCEHFKLQLKKNISRFRKIHFLDESEWREHSQLGPVYSMNEKLEGLEKNYSSIIYFIENENSPLMQVCLRKADVIYFLASGNSNPQYSDFVSRLLEHRKLLNDSRNVLVQIHQNGGQPLYTQAWLDSYSFSFCHHISIDEDTHYQRLIRYMSGNPRGLILGGGGVRGWAHLGAIKALNECKIPIDMIGGSSAGGIVGACFATSTNYEEFEEKFRQIMKSGHSPFSIDQITWPTISLLSSKTITDAMIGIFGNTHVEDLWLPYFCMSCNLNTENHDVHQNGLLWEKVRATSAVPGLVPPMVIGGQLHVDGGILNNLPVNIMRNILGSDSKIIAVSISPNEEDAQSYNFPPILTLKEALLTKVGWGYREYAFPSFTDIFRRSFLIASTINERQCGTLADLLIHPKLDQYKMFKISVPEENKLIEIGYQVAMAAINKSHFD